MQDLLASHPEAVVVVSLINGLGDSILALPALRRLAAWTDAQRLFLWVADDALRFILNDIPGVRCPVHVDRYGVPFMTQPQQDLDRTLDMLGRPTERVWVSFNAYYPCWPTDEELLERCQPVLARYSFGERPEQLRTSRSGKVRHMRDQYLRVIGEDVPASPQERRFSLNPDAVATAGHQLGALGIGQRYIAVHTDSAAEKEWSAASWAALLSDLERKLGLECVLVGKPSESVAALAPTLSGGWDVHAAVVARASAFVGIDSCFAHVANALDIPGVVLFGPSDPMEWGPAGVRMQVIRAHGSELAHIAVEDVYAGVSKLFNEEVLS